VNFCHICHADRLNKHAHRCCIHAKTLVYTAREGWTYWKCPEGCWFDVYAPTEKRPAESLKPAQRLRV